MSILDKISTTITVNRKKYLTRYYVLLRDWDWSFGNIFVHHFLSSDQGTNFHNHPWKWGISIVLFGGYFEERTSNPTMIDENTSHYEKLAIQNYAAPMRIERREVKPFSINFIRKSDFHRVDLRDEKRGAWTLFIAGPRTSEWGFLDRNTREFKHWSTNPEAIP